MTSVFYRQYWPILWQKALWLDSLWSDWGKKKAFSLVHVKSFFSLRVELTFHHSWVKSIGVYHNVDTFLETHFATSVVFDHLVKESNRSSITQRCLPCDSADFTHGPAQIVSFLLSLFLGFTHKLQRQHLFAENQYCLGLWYCAYCHLISRCSHPNTFSIWRLPQTCPPDNQGV